MSGLSALRPLRGWAVLLVLALLVFGVVRLTSGGGSGPTRSITAHFASAPGLYAGNQVDVLGMPIGKVTSVDPRPDGVVVHLDVPGDLDLPDQVQALLTAPNLISDRYIELYPAYSGGAKLAKGAEIPAERTAAPVSADQIIRSVDQLSTALGPNGANSSGDLSASLHSLAQSFGPDGKPLNQTITNFGQALGALGAQGSDLTTLLNGLGQLTTTASQNLDSYTSFSNSLASVSASLASEKGDIGTALATLQQALGQLSTFVTDNAATLAGSLQGLNTFAAALTRQQQALAATFRTGPLALQNLNAAVVGDPATGGKALKVRYDPTQTSGAFGAKLCGNSVLRLLTLGLAGKDGGVYDGKRTDDFLCGLNGLVSQLPVPSGAPAPALLTLPGAR